jgi:hypothetical protein
MAQLRDLCAVPDDQDSHDDPSQGRHRSTKPGESVEPEPRLVRSAVNGRVYVVTLYDQRDDGQIVPREKYDVSEDFEQLTDDPHIPFGPALYAMAGRLYDLACDETSGDSRAVRIEAIASSLAYTFRGQPAE